PQRPKEDEPVRHIADNARQGLVGSTRCPEPGRVRAGLGAWRDGDGQRAVHDVMGREAADVSKGTTPHLDGGPSADTMAGAHAKPCIRESCAARAQYCALHNIFSRRPPVAGKLPLQVIRATCSARGAGGQLRTVTSPFAIPPHERLAPLCPVRPIERAEGCTSPKWMHAVWFLNVQPTVNIIIACEHNGFLDGHPRRASCHINCPNAVLS